MHGEKERKDYKNLKKTLEEDNRVERKDIISLLVNTIKHRATFDIALQSKFL